MPGNLSAALAATLALAVAACAEGPAGPDLDTGRDLVASAASVNSESTTQAWLVFDGDEFDLTCDDGSTQQFQIYGTVHAKAHASADGTGRWHVSMLTTPQQLVAMDWEGNLYQSVGATHTSSVLAAPGPFTDTNIVQFIGKGGTSKFRRHDLLVGTVDEYGALTVRFESSRVTCD